MSDFRDPEFTNPRTEPGLEPGGGRMPGWGWIAGVAVVVVLLALAFGIRHEPHSHVAANLAPAPTTTHPLAPSAGTNPTATAPVTTVPPASPAAPGLTPAPAPAPSPNH